MPQTTRETIVDLLLDDSENKRILSEILKDDPFAQSVFKEEKINLLIEQYIDGSLSENKKNILQNLIKKYPAIKNEFGFRKKVNRSIKDMDLVYALERAYQEYAAEKEVIISPTKAKLTINFNPVIKWIAAASILIIISLVAYTALDYHAVNEEKLYDEYYHPMSFDQTDIFVVNSSALNSAKSKYFSSEYREAAIAFRNLPSSLDIRCEKNFFLALTFMELGSFAEAIEKFQEVMKNDDFEYLPHTHWYIGLCYLRTGQLEKATETFKYLVQVEGFNSDKASKILKKLN